MGEGMVIVSACLAGINCRYKGDSNIDEVVAKLVSDGKAIPICPEQLGGCPTPRKKAEIYNGTGKDVLDGKSRVLNEIGEDITEQFIKGAEETLKIAKLTGVSKAIMKAKSPSCGCGKIYDGTFSGKLTDGNGVASELLQRNGIEVVTESDI